MLGYRCEGVSTVAEAARLLDETKVVWRKAASELEELSF